MRHTAFVKKSGIAEYKTLIHFSASVIAVQFRKPEPIISVKPVFRFADIPAFDPLSLKPCINCANEITYANFHSPRIA